MSKARVTTGSGDDLMYICHCLGVTDRTIAAAIAAGATTAEEITRRCGAGAGCGGCWPALQGLLDDWGLAGHGGGGLMGERQAVRATEHAA